MGPGQLIAAVISPVRKAVHGTAAGVADAQHPGHLVKALPRRIIPGAAQHLHLRIGAHIHHQGGPAGDTQADEGRLQVWVGDVVGGDVAPHMVDRDQREIQGHSRSLGEIHPHQHRADEAGAVGDRHGVQIPLGQARLIYRLIGQAGHRLHVLSRGDLRHHAAVNGVHLDL